MNLIYIILLSIIIFVFAGYVFIKIRHNHWRKRNVKYLKPKHLILGNTADVFFNKVPLFKYHAKVYDELAPDKYGGYFNFLTPVIVIRDPELIKNVLTKDFSHFINRGSAFLDEDDALTLHLFNLPGERWKILRNKLTPTFTSGKIKNMFQLMKKCAQELTAVADETIDKEESFEMRDLMARFTTDVISSCVFGLESNSLKNPDSIFRRMGKKIFETSLRSRFIGFFSSFAPKLRRLLKLKFLGKEVNEFFASLVIGTVRYREENNEHRNDFIDLLIALKNETRNSNKDIGQENKFELTDKLMIAQCFVFFAAGFETSSGTSTFALYELAKNPAIQSKLFDEIDRTLKKHNNELTYDCLHEMSYLDQIVSETLRLYPVLPFLVRICNKSYQIDDNHTIEAGARVIVSVLGLHLDPQYYENPTVFNPENFSKEMKSQRHHYTYLPFGEGPRICIGMRFGLTQVKLSLLMLVRHYEIGLSPKMASPFMFSTTSMLATVEGGVWLTLKKRSSQ